MTKYRDLILNLLPTGFAWNKGVNSNLSKLAKAIGNEFARFDQRKNDLLNEADPRSASELLEDWERNFGLPDECGASDRTYLERRSQLLQKFTSRGGQTPSFFKQVIKDLGFDAEIVEHRPFKAGSKAGDQITNTKDWRFTFTVTLPPSLFYKFKAGQGKAGEPLAVYRDDSVKCIIDRIKPAHTFARYSFVLGE